LAIAEIVGGVFEGAWTVKLNPELTLFVPSLTEIVMSVLPLWFAAGVTFTVRFAPLPPKTILPFGTSAVEEELAESVRLAAAVSASPIVNGIAAVAVFSATVCAAIVEIVGGVFGAGASTVTVKMELALFVPSLTETVICALPVWFAAGVTFTVRLAPLPPNTILPFGTSVVDEELAERVKPPAAVSASPMVNAIAAVAWFIVTVWSAIEEIVGAVFTPTVWME
jgi:hypothetical protein